MDTAAEAGYAAEPAREKRRGRGTKHLRLLVVEDDPTLREALETTLTETGIAVHGAADGRQALAALASTEVDVVLTDVEMPEMDGHALLRELRRQHPNLPVVLMTAYGSIERAVDAMRDGAVDYLRKGFEIDTLLDLLHRIAPKQQRAGGDTNIDEPIAFARRSVETREMARRVAGSNASVLLSGESGTGKEVIARFIHQQSPRCEAPFVAVNCAAIPDSMLEAMLFGHEKGAFTGATQSSPGKFEQAQGGTLLLDEISEMPISLQPKLLRVLQECEVERVGGRRVVSLDVRVIATTNRNLLREVEAGRFRQDLYYRLSVMPIHLSPLRDRREDIVPLARAMLARRVEAPRPVPTLGECAAKTLTDYAWPGNVRELDNLIQRTVILCSSDVITTADLVFEGAGDVPPTLPAPTPPSGELKADMETLERERIIAALREFPTRVEAARHLGLKERTLRHKVKKLRDQGFDIDGPSGTGFAKPSEDTEATE
ncbi:MAG: sigma-54 dependent transcriptional regulator [Pseudomonadota bacterium]